MDLAYGKENEGVEIENREIREGIEWFIMLVRWIRVENRERRVIDSEIE